MWIGGLKAIQVTQYLGGIAKSHIFGSVLFILSLCMGGVLIDHVFSGYAVATSTQLSINYPLSVSVVPQFAVW